MTELEKVCLEIVRFMRGKYRLDPTEIQELYDREREVCIPLKCSEQRQLGSCLDCKEYPCADSAVGYRELEHKNFSL